MHKKIIQLLLAIAFFIPITKASFPDAEGHVFEEAINYVQEQGYVNGYPDGTYRPNQIINRIEFTKIIIAANFDLSKVKTDESEALFNDTENNTWYTPYLFLAVQNKIINGYPDGTFQPTQNINLAEALKIILESYQIEIEKNANQEWYQPYLTWAYKHNLLTNIQTNPETLVTRGDMAALIYRLEQLGENKTETATDSLSETRNEVLDLLNQERIANNLNSLDLDETLNLVAQNHAQDMQNNNYLSHESLDGSTFIDRIEAANISYKLAGENIAQGQKNAAEVVESWLKSPPHRANILNENFNTIGLGYVNGDNYWVLELIKK